MFEFKIRQSEGSARAGELATPHGTLLTPVFMPVGTHGAVKGVSPVELQQISTQIVLGNTYHLYLRPGDEQIRDLGGLHDFMNWPGPLLTDSGGFQVFSLGERRINGESKTALRQVAEEGITFRSHLDGSTHLFTPERSIQIQQNLGADIIMAFDQPVYGLSTHAQAEEAMLRTGRWLERSRQQWQRGDQKKQALFGIVQGGTHPDLHRISADFAVGQNLPGYAIGGLAVGEGKEEMWQAVESIVRLLPENRPRYFMGLGDPYDLIEATRRGIDMYDCVAPSRLARHGVIWQPVGEREVLEAFWRGDTERLLNGTALRLTRWDLGNRRFTDFKEKLYSEADPLPAGLGQFSLGSLHHYLKEGEMLGSRILTLHNIRLLHKITEHLKNAINLGDLAKLTEVIRP